MGKYWINHSEEIVLKSQNKLHKIALSALRKSVSVEKDHEKSNRIPRKIFNEKHNF